MSHDKPTTSALGRLTRIGGLMGRVGLSVVGEQVRDFARSDTTRQIRKTENLVRNAARVVTTLGEMKGAAMKVGQMLSLHEGLLPPEVAAILSALQQDAPSVPFEVMQYELEGEIDYANLFESLEPEAFAAASIGQVHRGVLKDGRRVAVKIQYPEIERIIRADLKNLKTVIGALFGLFSEMDFDPVWEEVRDRLFEELDYIKEADNIGRMAALHAGIPEIMIPQVVEEASTRRVLTMEYLEGISPQQACSDRYDQALKDRWGAILFEFQMRGLLKHRFLHTDPNLANFSFLDDGRVIVYDFGCVKETPDALVAGYSRLIRAALDQRNVEIPQILLDMGVHKKGNTPLPSGMIDPYIELVQEIFREEPNYTFGEDDEIYGRLLELGSTHWPEAKDVQFPKDVVFIDRSLAGHFGNLSKLRATGPWRELVLKYARARP